MDEGLAVAVAEGEWLHRPIHAINLHLENGPGKL